MKIVQDYLKELDREKLVDYYFEKVVPEINRDSYESDEPLNQLKANMKKRISKYIEDMIQVEAEVNPEHQGIIYAYEGYTFETTAWVVTELIFEDELIKNTLDTQAYAYEYTSNAEILGYKVAETDYVKHYIYEIISDVLYEMSFFGYNEEIKNNKRKELDDMVEEIESGKAKTIPFDLEEFRKNCGIYEPPKDEKREALDKDVRESMMRYNKYANSQELLKVLDIVNGKKK